MDEITNIFVTSEDYKTQIDTWYKINDITHEKCELFHDFILSLLDIIKKTHLGFDVIRTDEEIENHFSWCFNKVITSFENERVFFKRDGGHYSYFFLFFTGTFYQISNEDNVDRLYDHFNKLFDYNVEKTVVDVEILTTLYKLLEQNLKK